MMSMGRGYLFQIRERYVSVPDDPSLLFDDPIQVEIRLLSTLHNQPEITESNIFHRGQLLSNNTAWPTLSPVLSTLGLPINDQIPMIDEISNSTREMGAIRTCRGRRSRIMPEIILLIWIDIDDEDDPMDVAMAESMESGTFHPVPATMASIKALEKVVLDGSDHCTICLDEFCVGSEVTRMPCSHVYHQDCIVEWLKMSNLCPLCRFRMPS